MLYVTINAFPFHTTQHDETLKSERKCLRESITNVDKLRLKHLLRCHLASELKQKPGGGAG